MKPFLLFSFALLVFAPIVRAQNPDSTLTVPIKMYASGAMQRQSSNDSGKFALIFNGTSVASATIVSGQSLGNFTTTPATETLRTGMVYTIMASALIQNEGDSFAAGVSFVAPAGYQVYISGIASTETQVGLTTGFESVPIQICVMGPEELTAARAGSCTSIISGQVYWRANLGALENGDSAGSIVLSDFGTGSWSALGTRAALAYMAPSEEIAPDWDANGLRQILGDQANVDIVSFADGSYEIRFYNPKISPKQGSAFPYTFTNLPYVSYHVQEATSGSNPETDVITITSVTHTSSGLVTNTQLSTASPDPGTTATARVAVTTLTMTRIPSGSDYTGTYTWTLKDWNTSGSSQVKQETRVWGGTASARTETRTLTTVGSSNAAYVSKAFATYSFGETLTSASLGSSNPVAVTYASYTDASNTASYGFPETETTNSGAWLASDYAGQGQVADVYRPFNNSPAAFSGNKQEGEVDSYTYSNDPFGMPTRIASMTDAINGNQCGLATFTYQNAPSTYNGETVVVSSEVSSTGASSSLTSTKKFYAENADAFYAGKPFSEARPDGTMIAYAYEVGSFVSGEPANAADSRITVITGNSASGDTLLNSYNTCSIDPIYVINGKSIATVTIRNFQAEVARVETYAWLSGWQLIDAKDYSYDNAGFLTGETEDNTGLTRSRSYSGEQLLSETDAMGATTTYSNFDAAGRALTATNPTAPSAAFEFDAADRLTSEVETGASDRLATSYTFDDAGRLTAESHPGKGTTSYAYAYGSSGWTRTVATADGATTISSYNIDGRTAALSGTAVVSHTYSYALNASNQLQTTDYLGSSGTSSARWMQTTADWLGRTVQTQEPGFDGSASYVETRAYDSNGTFSAPGHLVAISRTGFAPILFNYDPMGNVSLVGMDLADTGQLQLNSTDRIIGYNRSITFDGSVYWYQQTKQIYPWSPGGQQSATAAETVASTQQRLTDFASGEVSDTETFDEYSNKTETTATVNAAANTLTKVTAYPGVTAGFETETISYGPTGLSDKTVAPDGLTTSNAYDIYRRLISHKDSRGNTTVIAPQPGTRLTESVADATGATTSRIYDAVGRLIQLTDPNGNITFRDYWPTGAVHHEWGSGTYPAVHGYDDFGMETSLLTYQAGNWTSASWPGDTSQTSAQTTWTYDAGSGLLMSKTDSLGTVNYTYNPRGQVSTRTFARGGNAKTTYGYYGDLSTDLDTGELKSVTYSDGTAPLDYQYTRMGQLYSVTDFTGTRDFIYDATTATQLDAIDLPAYFNSRQITRLYNKDALLPGRAGGFQLGTTASPDSDLEQDYYYSSNGLFNKLVSQCVNNTTTNTFTYNYFSGTDLVGGYTAGSAFQVTRTYEPNRDLLASIAAQQVSGGSTTLAQYSLTSYPNGQIKYQQQSGTAFSDYYAGESYQSIYNAFTYDGRGELVQAMTYRGASPGTGSPASSDALPGREFNYSYDNIGNCTQSGPFAPPCSANDSFTFNGGNEFATARTINTHRILGDTQSGASVTSNLATLGTLDRSFGGYAVVSGASSPTSVTAAVSASVGSGASAVVATSSSTFLLPSTTVPTYDADGNLTADGYWTYVYDAENRLKTMNSVSPGVKGMPYEIDFKYDYLGRRVEKIVQQSSSSGPTFDRKYVYDGENLVAEIDVATGNVVRTYAWGLDQSGSFNGAGGAGGLLSLTNVTGSTATTYFAGCDNNGNVTLLFNPANGSVAATYEYSPTGEPLRVQAPDSNVADNPFRFSSRFTDAESGLVCMDARYYSPALGRFINRDPTEEAGGLNLYGFCGNDALDNIDPWGTGDGDDGAPVGESYGTSSSAPTPGDLSGTPGQLPPYVLTANPWDSYWRTLTDLSPGSLAVALPNAMTGGLIPIQGRGFIGEHIQVGGSVQMIVQYGYQLPNGGDVWFTVDQPQLPGLPAMSANTESAAQIAQSFSTAVSSLNPGIDDATTSVTPPPQSGGAGASGAPPANLELATRIAGNVTSTALGFVPLVGEIKAVTELVTGKDAVTGEPINRWLAGTGVVLGLIDLEGVTNLFRDFKAAESEAPLMQQLEQQQMAGPSLRMTPDQQALKELVDEATLGGRQPLTVDQAQTVLDWSDEVGYPGVRAGPADVSVPSNWTANPVPHIHFRGVGSGHIPVDPGLPPWNP